MQPLKDLGPAVDLIQPMPYTAFQAMLDPMAPKGFRSYWRGEYLQSLSDAAIDTFVQHAPAHAAAGAPLTPAHRLPHRPRRHRRSRTRRRRSRTATPSTMFHPITMWQAPADDERLIAATRAFCDAMRPFATGAAYLNFTPEDRVRDAYGAGKYQRLVALKEKYDPDNLFRLNANIKPGSLATGAPAPA